MDCTATTFDPDTAEYVSAQGVLAYRFAQSVLFPRNNADISFIGLAGVNDGLPQRVSFSTYPNPARVAELRFALPKRERVDLSVYDIVGRKVATVASGVFQAGTYARSWNGRSDAGALQRPGMYLYRLRVGAETHTLRGIRSQTRQ